MGSRLSSESLRPWVESTIGQAEPIRAKQELRREFARTRSDDEDKTTRRVKILKKLPRLKMSERLDCQLGERFPGCDASALLAGGRSICFGGLD